MADPEGAIQQECGIIFSEDVVLHVHRETDGEFHMVLLRTDLTREEVLQVRGGWGGSFTDW